MNVKGQAAIVTGGASGLGGATASALAAAGAKVALFDLQDELGSAKANEIGGLYVKTNVSDAANTEPRSSGGRETGAARSGELRRHRPRRRTISKSTRTISPCSPG
jgi:NAD(P)-dependent dehydrogenase (short-subunit alcohol dehydrogenase family)